MAPHDSHSRNRMDTPGLALVGIIQTAGIESCRPYAGDGYTVFDLRGEAGNRRQSTRPAEHLAKARK